MFYLEQPHTCTHMHSARNQQINITIGCHMDYVPNVECTKLHRYVLHFALNIHLTIETDSTIHTQNKYLYTKTHIHNSRTSSFSYLSLSHSHTLVLTRFNTNVTLLSNLLHVRTCSI